MSFLCINGDILPDTSPVISIYNRSFNFGDGLVEEMRTRGDIILFLDDHWNYLRKAMTLLKMNFERLPPKSDFEFSVRRLLHRNKLLKSSCLKLIIVRKNGITQKDISDEIEYYITVQPLENAIFTISDKGLFVGIYTDIPKFITPFSCIKTTSNMQTVLSLIKVREKGINDVIFLNTDGNLVEATCSNLFVVQEDGTIFTTPLSDGCVDSVMRKKIIEIAKENKMNIIDTQSLGPKTLYNPTAEILLTNSIDGIQWVMGYRDKRYYNRMAKKLTELLNRKAGLLNL